MFPDFKDLIALLNRHKVKYLIVGGYAVALHAQPRATKDLDILFLPSAKNAAALHAALLEFGAPLSIKAAPDGNPKAPARRLTPRDFTDKGAWYTMGVPPVAIDILAEIPGVTFNTAWKNRSTAVVDESTGLTAHFISRGDLVAAKLAAARPRDLADVDELRKGAAARQRKSSKPATSRRTPGKKRS
jgi:hypothetical protein